MLACIAMKGSLKNPAIAVFQMQSKAVWLFLYKLQCTL